MYLYNRKVNVKLPPVSSQVHFTRGSKVLLVSQICSTLIKNETPDKIDLNDGLQKACEEGDTAIIKLMDQLKEYVIVVSKEYRTCLMRQIEITKTATSTGPLSEDWDELPQYRVLADELNKELNDYMAIFNTIGQMSHDETLVKFVTGTCDNLESIGVKYKELEKLLEREFEENRKFEKELLETNRDSILNNFTVKE
ncbi:hypothetical protein NQ318_019381 [Aromia moschata]|uniref:Uncharacterized protein n=1 Tax=Aromia moschata TaxID=1265417 RepID=A0AAV8XP33_9CUCU|nr:hypothetical protein NQ318_019381 [Aromia moschata]